MRTVVHISHDTIAQTLAQAPSQGKRLLEPLKSAALSAHMPIHVLECTDMEGAPEVHVREADLWICIEGQPVITVGGSLVDSRAIENNGVSNETELTGTRIEGGTEYLLAPGDVLLIPEGIPHALKSKGVARLYIIKLPA